MPPVDGTMAVMCHVLLACCMLFCGSGCRCDYYYYSIIELYTAIHESMNIHLMQDIFGNIDDNADGGISFEEFVGAMQKRAKKVKE